MPSRRRSRGFGLVEVMFSIVIATVVLGMAVGVITQFNGNFVRQIAETQGVERVQKSRRDLAESRREFEISVYTGTLRAWQLCRLRFAHV
jgi:prepilin-type N-terminal cleavage/methylation domain-containing protein